MDDAALLNFVALAVQNSNRTHPHDHLGGPGVTRDQALIGSEDSMNIARAVVDALTSAGYTITPPAKSSKA